MFRELMIVNACVFLISCGSNDDDVENSAKLLVAADFNITPTVLSASEIQTFLEDSSFIFNTGLTRQNLVEEFNGQSDEDPCLPASVLQSSDSNGYVVALNDTNLASCNNGGLITYSKYVISAYYDYLTLYDASYNPVMISDLSPLMSIEMSGIRVRARYYGEVAGSANIYGDVINLDATLYAAIHGELSFDSPCSVIDDVIDQCVIQVVMHISDNDGEGHNSYKFTYNNVQELADAPYYGSGTVSFVANNWTGVVTYYGGTMQPSFTATNGSETVSGNLYNYWY